MLLIKDKIKEGGKCTVKSKTVNTVVILLLFIIAVSAAALLTGCSEKEETTIVINEVVSSNDRSVTEDSLGSPDWIELYNTSDNDISLQGYKIANKNQEYTFGNTVIKTGGYLVVYAEKSAASTGDDVCCASFGISKSGGELFIADPEGKAIDQIMLPALAKDESYARRSDGTYGYCTDTTPGKENDNIKTEDELKSEISTCNIVISEVLPKGAGGESWVELYNAGNSSADLDDYCLTDNEGDPSKWHIPESKLDAGKYAVIYMAGDKQGNGLCASFCFNKGDTGAYLYDINGILKSNLKWESGAPGGISVVADNTYTIYPTIGTANSKDTFSSVTQQSMDSSDPVRINEVLIKDKFGITDSSGNHSGWIELYNSSSNRVSLSGYYLSDDEGDLIKWALPDKGIDPGGYVVVFLTGVRDEKQPMNAPFKLSDGETCVYLTEIKGMKIAAFGLPKAAKEDISVGCDDKGSILYYTAPTPGSKNSEGTSNAPENSYPDMQGVYISEVSAASEAKKNDWIELHNGSKSAVNLEGYYLSDDTGNIKKLKIGALSIDAGGYVVIEASADATAANIANFGISPSGDTLILSDKNGTVIDAFETGVLSPGVTSGRIENGKSAARVFFTLPTRGRANSTDYKMGYTAEPEFSDTALYHKQAFSLNITCATSGSKIYYTTDGSDPDSNSKLYTEPIKIDDNTPVRAIAYFGGLFPSAVKTSTYIFDAQSTLPVVCLTGSPDGMKKIKKIRFSAHSKPEYPMNVEYYEQDGTPGVSFESGVHPKGKYSLNYKQKSLKLCLRSSYGQNEVTYPFFEGSKVDSFATLTLRSSGQDFMRARMRDSFLQKVASGLKFNIINTKPVVGYINGEFSGIYDLNEEQNDKYFESYCGLNKNNIDIIDFDGSAKTGNNDEFQRLQRMVCDKDLSDDAAYQEYTKYIDVDAFTDYLVMQTYFANGDTSNIRFWRARDYSVKWRPILHDLDWSLLFANGKGDAFSKYFGSEVTSGRGTVIKTYVFKALKRNKSWREKFINRYVELAETQFSPDRIMPIFDSYRKELEPEMPKLIDKYHVPNSMSYWRSQVSDLRSWVENRRPIALKQLQRYFNVSDGEMQELIKKYSAGNVTNTGN